MSTTGGDENQVLKGFLRGMGRKREIKYGWNSPLTHSASKKNEPIFLRLCVIEKNHVHFNLHRKQFIERIRDFA
jgi:hypothetical protein